MHPHKPWPTVYVRVCVWFCLSAAQLMSWSLILYGTADAPRVLVDYLSSNYVHQSSTQTRQASTAKLETSVYQPPSTGDSSAAAATTISIASSASGRAATTEVSSSVARPTYVAVERNISTAAAHDRFITSRPTPALNFTQGLGTFLTRLILPRVFCGIYAPQSIVKCRMPPEIATGWMLIRFD